MSANHAPSGPSALKSRLTRSGAAFARGAAGFSPPFGLLAQPRAVPDGPPSRMMRATRLREVRTPYRLGSASLSSRALGPRDRRAQ